MLSSKKYEETPQRGDAPPRYRAPWRSMNDARTGAPRPGRSVVGKTISSDTVPSDVACSSSVIAKLRNVKG
jgi:hypothetical protein